ncbi:MAG: type III-B CRISPR module-associated protein Cmr5 [Desulfurococcales archaeon]|nr:type III-B CRISPR module-associated protein Cmr5 [Desulfurococcales archaeon]
MSRQLDMVELAMKHALRLNQLVSTTEKGKDLAKKLRSRARELPSLIMDNGLVVTLLFYLSKAENPKIVENSVKIMLNNERIKDSILNPGKYAYALIAASVLTALKETGIIKIESDASVEDIVKILIEKRESQEVMITGIIEEYVVNLKRAAEFLWEEE